MTRPKNFPESDFAEITGVPLAKIVQEAYARSEPMGMGMLHFVPGPLPDSEANAVVSRLSGDPGIALSMDYVKGRAVKMTVFTEDGRLFVRKDWFDHDENQFDEFMEAIGK